MKEKIMKFKFVKALLTFSLVASMASTSLLTLNANAQEVDAPVAAEEEAVADPVAEENAPVAAENVAPAAPEANPAEVAGANPEVASPVVASPAPVAVAQPEVRAAANAEPAYTAAVTFVADTTGWDGSPRTTSTVGNFTMGSDIIGMQGAPKRDGYSLGVQYFMGWSTMKDYKNPNAKIVLDTQPIKDAFPNGIPADAKLYAIYVSQPALVETLATTPTIKINKEETPQSTLPESKIANTNGGFDSETEGADKKEVIAEYNENQDKVPVNLNASFAMDPLLSLVTYHNPDLRIAGSLDQANQDASSTAKDVTYVHVDLTFNLPEEVKANDTIAVTFKSYNFFPWMVLKEYGAPALTILDSNGNEVDLATLSTNASPLTSFKIKLDGAQTFILRTRLRNNPGLNKMIANATAAQILEDMKVISDSPENFYIEKADAKKLAETNTKVNITGYIDGATFINHRLTGNGTSPFEIPKTVAAKDIQIGFVLPAEEPKQPEQPDVPEKPEQPEKPETPVTPEEPKKEDKPEVKKDEKKPLPKKENKKPMKKAKSSSKKAPKTGDATQLVTYSVLGASLLGIVSVSVLKKKED